MLNTLLYIYGVIIFFYSLTLIGVYVFLIYNSKKQQNKSDQWDKEYIRQMVNNSPYVPGVSIVAGAYNEENTIIDNVNSLLSQEYPIFEVVIVNDGSKDETLERMVEAFELIEVPYDYEYKVFCRPFKRLFRSVNPKYDKLTVVDKENGGTKADAINGGLNVIKYPYFINTDADCLIAKDAIYQCIFPILLDNTIIAVSGTMSMSNGFKINDETNEVEEYKAPNNLFALFQDLEYKRSFLIGKMGWSNINAMPNVSGGYGLFNTNVVINAGGYSYDSFAEDMDMLWRMIGYCCNFKKPYKVVQIPHTCCWTEGPARFRILKRQRMRWGRGLFQLIHKHKKMAFKRQYKQLGLITFPYEIIFEFLAPIIETVGWFTMIYLLFTGGINWNTFWIMFLAIYLFSFILSGFVIFYDYIHGGSYNKATNYLKLLLAAMLEPFVYHPLITYFNIRGYLNFLFKKEAKWGDMEHKGAKKK